VLDVRLRTLFHLEVTEVDLSRAFPFSYFSDRFRGRVPEGTRKTLSSLLTGGVLDRVVVSVPVVFDLTSDEEDARDDEKGDRHEEVGVGVPRPSDARR